MGFKQITLLFGAGLALLTALSFFAYKFHFPLHTGFFAFVFIVAISQFVYFYKREKKVFSAGLKKYNSRGCSGILWRRNFPDEPKVNIREFLDQFNICLGIPKSKFCHFSPNDSIAEIYKTLYPPEFSTVDYGLELEIFAQRIDIEEEPFLDEVWNMDLTLGNAFKKTSISNN